MNVKEIPQKIFERISSNCGIEAPDWSFKSKDYRVSQIFDPEKKKLIGFMGYRHDKEDDFSILYFWLRLPSKDDFDSEPLLVIKAGPVESGAWAYGQGRHMQEKLVLHFSGLRIAGDLPLNRAIGFAITYAAELAQKPEYKGNEFWEKERKPDCTFTSPP